MSKRLSKTKHRSVRRSLLDMTAKQARTFFLKSESYCNVDFPEYFQFGEVIGAVAKVLKTTPLHTLRKESPREHEGVNYSLLTNKDGRYAWRPFQLIHPAIYVALVHQITDPAHWKTIMARFGVFRALPRFSCLSIPVESASRRKDRAEQILQWWTGMEQGSIELALGFSHVFHADIADCFGSIYTHSVAWAIHDRDVAKKSKQDKSLIGNVVDWHVQDMRHGQTNGIPQGSVLMDFIAELVLGYADLELSKRIDTEGITEFQILRYRDDYRIFVNDSCKGEVILKLLTEVMIGLGLKLNSGKTKSCESVVHSSLKSDKLAWLRGRQGDLDLQRHLLIIHGHSLDHPNAGSLLRPLERYCERLSKAKKIANPSALVSIAVDIAYTSPRAFPFCAVIVSMVLRRLESDAARIDLISRIHRKLDRLPNTGHMQVWLQRISYPYDPSMAYDETLCKLVAGSSVSVWNSDWLASRPLRRAMDQSMLVDRTKLKKLKPVMKSNEVSLFAYPE